MFNILALALPWLLIAAGCWLVYQLIRQYGRLVLRLEGVEEQLGLLRVTLGQASEPGGLSVGEPAPNFELPDLDGHMHALAEFVGQRVLIIFFSPQCGYCVNMLPELAKWSPDRDGAQTVPLIVTSGKADEIRQFVQQHHLRCLVLLQKDGEIASRLLVRPNRRPLSTADWGNAMR
jgi:peroxiredoxin